MGNENKNFLYFENKFGSIKRKTLPLHPFRNKGIEKQARRVKLYS